MKSLYILGTILCTARRRAVFYGARDRELKTSEQFIRRDVRISKWGKKTKKKFRDYARG